MIMMNVISHQGNISGISSLNQKIDGKLIDRSIKERNKQKVIQES